MNDISTRNTLFPVFKKMDAKGRAKLKIIEYIGNLENDFPNRSVLARNACGYKDSKYIYRLFTLSELAQIEQEGLEIRRSKYARFMAALDYGLLKKANKGDVAAIKLAYQKFEGWQEGSKVVYPDKDGNPQQISGPQMVQVLNISEERLRLAIEELKKV